MIVDPQWFPKIPDPITEEEHDMLDLAFGLTETYVVYFIAFEKKKGPTDIGLFHTIIVHPY